MIGKITGAMSLAAIFFLASAHASPRDESGKMIVETTKLAPNLVKLRFDVVNVVALVGPEGVLLSDAAYVGTGASLVDELSKLGGDTIRYLICTHYHHDHCGGAKTIGKQTTVIAHRNVRKLLSSDQTAQGTEYEAFPEKARPDVVFSNGVTVHINGEIVEVSHLPNGHSDGDSIVFFKKANVVHVGDLLFSDNFPAVDYEHGGRVEGLAKNLQTVIDEMPPEVRVVAGHGRDYSIEELRRYRSMIVSTTEVIRGGIESGKSLEEMKAQGVLDDWREDWTKLRDTTDLWIETIYRSLTGAANP